MRQVALVTTDTTIDDSYSGYDVLAKGGRLTLTLASAAPADFADIRIINADDAACKLLVGFPADLKPKLYPHQSLSLNSKGGTWFTVDKPGRYQPNAQAIIWIDGTASGGGDGLSQANAVNSMAGAIKIMQRDIDLQQYTPILAVRGGQEYVNDDFLLFGNPVSDNLVQLSPWGGGVATITNDIAAITVGDNAELDIRIGYFDHVSNFIFQGNRLDQAQVGHIVVHNGSGVLDMEGGPPLFIGAGANDTAIFMDGPTAGAAIANGFNVQGSFECLLRMDEGGGRYTMSGMITPSGNPTVGSIFKILGSNQLILGGPQSPLSGYASLGPSIISGKGQIVMPPGFSIPGGYVTRQSGEVFTSKY